MRNSTKEDEKTKITPPVWMARMFSLRVGVSKRNRQKINRTLTFG